MLPVRNRSLRLLSMVCLLALLAGLSPLAALGQVAPPLVEAELFPGGSLMVDKEVTTPDIPPLVDICLLEDETGSFGDDIANLRNAAPNLYDTIVATSPDAQFAVAGFRDYPTSFFGSPGDWVYRLLSAMNPAKAAWLDGVNALTASGGADTPEAQYDAIVAAAGPGTFTDPTLGVQGNCGWRADPRVQRVLVVATDASFHLPGAGKPHVNDQASTLAALQAQNIILVGLKALGAGGELDALAAATGGSVQPLSSDGANIAAAILAALAEITTDVWWEASCDMGLAVSLAPEVYYDVAGGTLLTFQETVAVPNATPPGDYTCTVTFIANDHPEEGAPIGQQTVNIRVVPIPVPLDIRPTSCPNPLNTNLKGVLPVAILGTADLDVTTIDPATLLLEGVAPLRWSYEDVATPYQPFLGKPLDPYACNEYGPDGFMDLVLHFDAQSIVAAIGPVSDGDVLLLMLTGNFYDGRAIAGEDVVKIIKKK
jgi:hypothetical protein